MSRLFEVLRGLQQRLGRNAADVGAGAAERRLALRALPVVDARGRKAELRRADRGDVAAWTAADHDNVKRLCHNEALGETGDRPRFSESASVVGQSKKNVVCPRFS